jgi:uncharacterized protein
MSTETNKALVVRFMTLFSESRLDAAFELLAADVRWTLWGSGAGSGEYTKGSMLALMRESLKWFDGPITWTPTGLMAEDDRVAVEAISSGRTRGGYLHRGTYHNLFVIREGKIREVREMFLETPVRLLFEALERESTAGR